MKFNMVDTLAVRSISCGLTITMLGTSILAASTQQSEQHLDQEVINSQFSEPFQSHQQIIDAVNTTVSQLENTVASSEPRETYLMYVDKSSVYYRSRPIIDDRTALGVLAKGEEVDVIKQNGEWCQCVIDEEVVYVHADLLVEECTIEDIIEVNEKEASRPAETINCSEAALNSVLGRVDGPSGEETYYNRNMKNCVKRMHDLGYEGEYWIREDGVKMFGDYVMIAANFEIRPLGTILETSLGTGCVCDTGEFVTDNPYGIDVATNW